MDFSMQATHNGIVPIFRRDEWARWCARDGVWRRSSESAARSLYRMLWALYTFKREDGTTGTVEGRMLMSRSLHDFCGGLMLSSGTAVSFSQKNKDPWGHDYGFCYKGGPGSSLEDLKAATVPSLHQWFECKSMTDREAQAVMRRSLMAAAIGHCINHHKGLLFGFDRTENGGTCDLRDVMRSAESLAYVFTGAFVLGYGPPWLNFADATEEQRRELGYPSEPPEFNPDEDYAYGGYASQMAPYRLTYVATNEIAGFKNPNSGREVGAIHVLFSSSPMGVPDEGVRGPLHLCESNPHVRVPRAIRTCIANPLYYRLAASSPFANG